MSVASVSRQLVDPRPLVAHVVFRFDYGGLENGVVNLINRMPPDAFRHCVIALTEATDFRRRIRRDDVAVHDIGKKPGKDPRAYLRLYRLLRRLRPAILHTRNVGTIDCAFVGWLAGVPVRIHGEHGWDIFDPDGTNRRYRAIRRFMRRFITKFVTVSEDLRSWLVSSVGIDKGQTQRICNGVDADRFHPRPRDEPRGLPDGFAGADSVIIGSVTRFSKIKDPLNLVDAFISIARSESPALRRARLVMIGGGELHAAACERLDKAGVHGRAWLPGKRDDVPELLRKMDLFVLGSLREGISNTILEAMATGLPVVATATGGNRELVTVGETGTLVPPGDSDALAEALGHYLLDEAARETQGRNAREAALSVYSLGTMVANYLDLYRQLLQRARG
jgi:sugar transferase (PEP-CTERM/EpsH1 system associated)